MIPPAFARFVEKVFEAEGAAWVRELPHLLEKYARMWGLRVGEPFPNLSYNFVVPAVMAGGRRVVLKMGVPRPELIREAAALAIYNGRGAVKLLAADPAQGVLLLERLYPGRVLHAGVADDDEATRTAAQLMQMLWRPAPKPNGLCSLSSWGGALRSGGMGVLDEDVVGRAAALFDELTDSASECVVLHGDLHHENILSAGGAWCAIDPKGLVGDPYYEPAPFLYNPLGVLAGAEGRRLLHRRLDVLAESLGFERERLAGYGFCQAVLSAVWSVEDQTDYGYAWHVAGLF